jgi:hypothetical protein
MRPRREGLWDSRQLIKIANRVIEIEEATIENGKLEHKDMERQERLPTLWPEETKRVLDAKVLSEYTEGQRMQAVEFVTRSEGLEGGWNVWTERIAW